MGGATQDQDEGIAATVSWPLHALIALVGVLSSTVYGLILRPRLPERVPIHWDLQGRPDGWASSMFWWTVPLVMLLCYGILWLVVAVRPAWGDRASTADTASLRLQYRRTAVRMAEWTVLAAHLALAVLWLGSCWEVLGGQAGQRSRAVIAGLAGLLFAVLIPGFVFGRKLAQQGALLQHQLKGAAFGPLGSKWFLGGNLYWGKDDKRLLVPKLSGIGWTLNFARPAAWPILVLLIGMPLLFIYFLGGGR